MKNVFNIYDVPCSIGGQNSLEGMLPVEFSSFFGSNLTGFSAARPLCVDGIVRPTYSVNNDLIVTA